MTFAQVTLVDQDDRELGAMEKLAAHVPPGRLHRAFSVVVLDTRRRVLLQRRAAVKYHFGGRWTNTCCSHPQPGDDLVDSAQRRLFYEMGVRSDDLRAVGRFEYRAEDPRAGLVEHELDHVIVGSTSDTPAPRPDEVAETRWVELEALRSDVDRNGSRYTPWLASVLSVVGANLEA